MALLEEQFTETLNAGAPDITYEGSEGREQQIAQALWDRLPPQARMQFGSFQQFFSSGAWKQVLQMLQQQMQGQEGPQERIQETETIQTQPQQGIASMMPAQMARGGTPEEVISLMEGIRTPRGEEVIDDTMTLASAPSIESEWWDGYQNYLAGGGTLDFEAWKELTLEGDHKPGEFAHGGIAGADGRMQYGIGSWFQKKIMDPIKKNIVPIGLGAASLYGLHKYGGEEGISGGLSKVGTKIGDFFRSPTWQGQTDEGSKTSGGLKNLLMNPNFLIPAAGLFAGTFAKKDDPGYTGQGTGLNLQDIGRIANITDPKTAMASGLRFSPDLETRKFTPEEMLQSYAATDAKDFSTPGAAQGGRIGFAPGGSTWREFLADKTVRPNPDDKDWKAVYHRWLDQQRNKAQGGRIRAQEGGLMDLGGMEKDYRNDGGFVPIGGEEKADDVPARLSRNEFVFTADAVRNAGAGDMDRGAQVMENVMKNLEGGGRISDESQGKGAAEMFEVSERLSEVV